MSNPLNNATLTGRLSQELKVWDNKDGSKTVAAKIAVDDNYKTKGEIQTNHIPLRVFVPKTMDGIGSWNLLNVGDLFTVNAALVAKPYTDKNGQKQFPLEVQVDGFPQFLESKATVEARAAKKAAAQPAADAPESEEDELARLRAESAQRNAPAAAPAEDYSNVGPYQG